MLTKEPVSIRPVFSYLWKQNLDPFYQTLDGTLGASKSAIPAVLPDLQEIKCKLKENVYKHTHECITDVCKALEKYENSAKGIVASGIGNTEEVKNMFALKDIFWMFFKDCLKTASEAYSIIVDNRSYNGLSKDDRYYLRRAVIGPVRNLDMNMQGYVEPSLFLTNISLDHTLQDLIYSYNVYTIHTNTLDFSQIPLYLHCRCQDEACLRPTLRCLGEDLFNLQMEAEVPLILNLAFPRKTETMLEKREDIRSIDALVDFIQGSDKKCSKKKKKGKRKRKTILDQNENMIRSITDTRVSVEESEEEEAEEWIEEFSDPERELETTGTRYYH